MLTMIGLSGSLRQGSFNSSLLRAAAELVPEVVELRIATIRGIPLYDGDLEAAEGIPAPVVALKDGIAAADALLLATPEYNNSIPGVMKNAVDWLSRPASDIRRVFGRKPVALIGASPGGFGTILSQNAWLPVLRTLGAQLWSEGRPTPCLLLLFLVATLTGSRPALANSPPTLSPIANLTTNEDAGTRRSLCRVSGLGQEARSRCCPHCPLQQSQPHSESDHHL